MIYKTLHLLQYLYLNISQIFNNFRVGKVYTVSGVLSMDAYVLKARLPHTVNISDAIIGNNNTLQFSIGNTSKMEITTSFKLPTTDYVFDGALTIDQNGMIEIEVSIFRIFGVLHKMLR